MLQLQPAPVGIVGLAGHLARHPLPDPGVITPAVRRAARAVWADLRAEYGFGPTGTLLTAPDANQKIAKSERLVWSLTLSPAASSGAYNTCVRYKDCEAICVLTSGKGALPVVQRSRDCRTALLYRAPLVFAILLADEIDRAATKADGAAWGLRANAASDIPWEVAGSWIARRVADLGGRTYDYTKVYTRRSTEGYRLTFSADSRMRQDIAASILADGDNVAVILPVKKGEPIPATWLGFPTIDGDVNDARCDDPSGVIVVLRAKGSLRGKVGHPMMMAL